MKKVIIVFFFVFLIGTLFVQTDIKQMDERIKDFESELSIPNSHEDYLEGNTEKQNNSFMGKLGMDMGNLLFEVTNQTEKWVKEIGYGLLGIK